MRYDYQNLSGRPLLKWRAILFGAAVFAMWVLLNVILYLPAPSRFSSPIIWSTLTMLLIFLVAGFVGAFLASIFTLIAPRRTLTEVVNVIRPKDA